MKEKNHDSLRCVVLVEALVSPSAWPRGNIRLGKDFDAYFVRSIRVKPPWWKFKACVHRNDIGKMWQVYLTDEATYTERRTLELDCHISQDTGQVVGVNLFDEQLKYKDKEEDRG